MWPRDPGKAFEAEVMPHVDALYGVAVRLTRDARDAEDLVQETVLRAYRFFHRYEPGTNCRAWLFKILHNLFRTDYQRRARERETLATAQVEQALPSVSPAEVERRLIDGSLSDEVVAALDRLPEEFRTAVLLCDVEEMSYREIADVMGTPVGTVMSRLHRGRKLLAQMLSGAAEERGGHDAEVIPLHRGRP